MSVIAPGTPAPEFTLKTEEGEEFTRADLVGQTTIIVFYPFTFSPVCTDQLQVYEEALGEIAEKGARVFAVSVDNSYAQTAFREKLNVTIPQLSDFEPKGETAKKLGTYFDPAGMTNRAIVIFGPDATVRWSYLAASPGDLPGANLILEALDS